MILLDDDCLPEKILLNYLYYFKNIKDNEILCGSVKYLNSKIKENFTRYRQSRHFVNNKTIQ